MEGRTCPGVMSLTISIQAILLLPSLARVPLQQRVILSLALACHPVPRARVPSCPSPVGDCCSSVGGETAVPRPCPSPGGTAVPRPSSGGACCPSPLSLACGCLRAILSLACGCLLPSLARVCVPCAIHPALVMPLFACPRTRVQGALDRTHVRALRHAPCSATPLPPVGAPWGCMCEASEGLSPRCPHPTGPPMFLTTALLCLLVPLMLTHSFFLHPLSLISR